MMGKKILVIEDDRAIVEVVKIILETEGHTVFTAATSDEAYRIIEEDIPHLVLLDIWLGGHDGGKIAKILKTTNLTKHIPVVMTSANSETEKIATVSGADGFLLKPFTIDELLQVIQKYTSG